MNNVKKEFNYIVAGTCIGAFIAPVISVVVVLILNINSLFAGMLTGLVIGAIMPYAGLSIGQYIYNRMEEEKDDQRYNENSEINEETDNTHQS